MPPRKYVGRKSHVLAVMAGRLWLIGGEPTTAIVWSDDGKEWNEMPSDFEYLPAEARSSLLVLVRSVPAITCSLVVLCPCNLRS